MKRMNRKSVLLVLSVVLLLTATVGGTLAYLIDMDGPVTNIFDPSEVKCSVHEGAFTDGTSTKKTGVYITNDGDVSAFIRVAIVANWCDDAGNVVEPYTGTIGYNGGAWVLHNGYYYHKAAVPANENTANLIEEFETPSNPNGLHLEWNIISQAVQAEGTASDGVKAVVKAWGVDPTTLK